MLAQQADACHRAGGECPRFPGPSPGRRGTYTHGVRKFALPLLALCALACAKSPTVEGTWTDGEGDMKLSLNMKADRSWELKAAQTSMSGTYTQDGEKVKMLYKTIGGRDVKEFLKGAGHAAGMEKMIDQVKNGVNATFKGDTLTMESGGAGTTGVTFKRSE